MYDFWARKTRPRMQDPKKRDLLAPIEPPYYFATKRPGFEIDYYEQCDKSHVEVTNSPIREITETGILSDDGTRDFDIIAICTGYDAVTGGLKTMGIKGRDGIGLQEAWKEGVRAHVGMLVHGFPNMYLVYGPHGKQTSQHLTVLR
jgi:cation diffusion facilitator CzcD-associated flavoprotein CzcO